MSARRTLILIAAVLFGALGAFIGYTVASDPSDDSTEQNQDPTTFTANDPGGSLADAKFTRIYVDGMPCILYKDSGPDARTYSGLTCDWLFDNVGDTP